LQVSDVDAMFAIKADPKVAEAYGREPHKSIDETRRLTEDDLNPAGQRNSLFWVVVPEGEEKAIGSCCYWNFQLESECAELGYELNRAYWGKGIMREAIPPILSYGFNILGLNRVEACPLAENAQSIALLLRLGFKYEGNLRQRISFRSRFIDLNYYSLLKSEWSPVTVRVAGPQAV